MKKRRWLRMDKSIKKLAIELNLTSRAKFKVMDYLFNSFPTEFPFVKECEGRSPMSREGMNVG
jgi:hypothetical protein